MQTNRRLDVIDYLKGFSIFTIVLYHLLSIYMKSVPNIIRMASSLGGTGVHVFILCSGFGLFYSQLNNPLTYSRFLKKRFTRVYIPYIIIVLISAFFPFMYTNSDKIIAVLSHILLFKMFYTNYESSFGTQFWFMSTILQFYIIFYGLIKIKQVLGNKLFITTSFLASLIWWLYVASIGKADIRIWNSFFLQYVWEFSLGIILAEKYYHYQNDRDKDYIPKKVILLVVALIGLTIFGVAGIKGGIFTLFDDIPALFGYGALAVLIYRFNIKVINNIFLDINKFSYEWYLVHILVFSCTFKLLTNILPQVLVGIISFALSILIAYLYNKILSKYLLKVVG